MIRFFIDFGSILDPPADPKIRYFSGFLALVVGLGPSWRQDGAQSGPRQLRRSIFKEFCTILGSIFEEISKIFERMFHTIFKLMSHSM